MWWLERLEHFNEKLIFTNWIQLALTTLTAFADQTIPKTIATTTTDSNGVPVVIPLIIGPGGIAFGRL